MCAFSLPLLFLKDTKSKDGNLTFCSQNLSTNGSQSHMDLQIKVYIIF